MGKIVYRHNIDPLMIEDAIKKHPGVLHVAAVGKPDAYAGELPVAYVQRVAGSSATAQELAAFAQEHVPERAAVPKDIQLLDSMPLTDIGKPDKVALCLDAAKRAYAAALSAALGSPVSVEVGPDAVHGTRVTISASQPGCPADELERRVAAVMKAYPHHFVVAR